MNQPDEVAQMVERIDRAETALAQVCKRGWTMHVSVPVRPDHDDDIVIGDGLKAGRNIAALLERLQRELAEAKRWADASERDLYDIIGQCDTLRARLEAAEAALARVALHYCKEIGGDHDVFHDEPDCPADDTCRCAVRRVLAQRPAAEERGT